MLHAEQVRFERLTDLGEVRVDGALPGVIKDRGVVHEHVEPREFRCYTGSCALDTLRIGDVELAGADGAAIPREIRGGTLALGRVARSEHHVVSAARQLATHFEPDPAVRTGDERHRGSLSPARFPSPPYRSVHTASSLPLGSVKWNRRPPGKENVGFTIFPPACLTFASTSSSRVA